MHNLQLPVHLSFLLTHNSLNFGALWRRWLPVSFLSCCICCCISCLTLCLFFCKSCFFFFLRLCLYKLNVEIYIIFMYPAVTLFCCYFSPVFYRFIINNNQIITNRYLCQNACICRRLCSYMKCCGINFSIFCADSFCQFFIIWYYIFTFYISVNITGLDTIPTIVSCFKDCSCGIVIQLSKYLAVRIWFWTNIYIIIYLRDCNICIFRSNNRVSFSLTCSACSAAFWAAASLLSARHCASACETPAAGVCPLRSQLQSHLKRLRPELHMYLIQNCQWITLLLKDSL